MKFSARLRLFSGIVLIMHEVLAVRLMMNNADKRTVIITGANRGIGLAATKALAATSEWNIVMACRSKARGDYAKLSLPPSLAANIEVKELDLADLRSIDSFVEDWGKRPLHVLACNAGIQKSKSAGFGGPEDVLPERTAQGFEATVGTNHIGHFHLVKKLLKNVNAVDKGRIVYVGSGVHNPEEPGGDVGSKAGLGDLRGLEQGFKAPVSMVDGSAYDPDKAYKDSKLCNVMTSLELARRLAAANVKTTSNVMNPGLIPTTGLFRDLNPIFVYIFAFLTKYVFKVAVSEEEGGRRLAFMIANPSLDGITGAYYSGKPGLDEFKPISVSKEAMDQAKGAKLWYLTEKIIANSI